MKDGTVIIVGSGQCGTLLWQHYDTAQVILRNGDLWTGEAKECRIPQSAEEIEAAPLEVDRYAVKSKTKRNRK